MNMGVSADVIGAVWNTCPLWLVNIACELQGPLMIQIVVNDSLNGEKGASFSH